MDVAFLAGIVYGLTEAVKAQFGTNGQVTRLVALVFGLLLVLGTDVRVLAEYGADEWLDVIVTTLAVGLGITTVFHRTQQALGLRTSVTRVVAPSGSGVELEV